MSIPLYANDTQEEVDRLKYLTSIGCKTREIASNMGWSRTKTYYRLEYYGLISTNKIRGHNRNDIIDICKKYPKSEAYKKLKETYPGINLHICQIYTNKYSTDDSDIPKVPHPDLKAEVEKYQNEYLYLKDIYDEHFKDVLSYMHFLRLCKIWGISIPNLIDNPLLIDYIKECIDNGYTYRKISLMTYGKFHSTVSTHTIVKIVKKIKRGDS